MSKAIYVPCQTEIKTVVIQPEKVVLELSVEQAKVFKILLGRTTNGTRFDMLTLYNQLDALVVLRTPNNYISSVNLDDIKL